MKKSPADKEKGQSVEDIFRNGFSEAESAPPPRIWENVHREMENKELHRYRQQAKWYRSMAAALLLLLLSAGIIVWQQQESTPMVGQQEGTLASAAGQKNQKAPAASAPHGPAADVNLQESSVSEMKDVTEGTETEASESQITPEVLASVSRAFSGKQAQNEAVVKGAPNTGTYPLNEPRTAPSTGKAPQSTKENPAAPEALAEAKPESERIAIMDAERPVTDRTILAKGAEDKPFPWSAANNLAFSRGLPAGSDSAKAAPERSILVQKEAPITTLAQTPAAKKGNEAEESDVYKWSVTMAYSPQYAYAPVKLSDNSVMNAPAVGQNSSLYAQYREAVEEYNHSYTPTYSYAALVGASYQINDKWQLETGVLYTQNEATTTQSYLVYQGGLAVSPAGFDLGNSAGKSTPLVTSAFNNDVAARAITVDRTDRYNTRYRYQQVGLPVRLAYRLNMKKLYALFSGGLNMNLLVQNTIMPETNQITGVKYGLNDKDSPFRTVQWATTTSIGVGYDVTKKMSVLLAPEFTYSLSPMLRESQKQANTYQLGVSIGGRWRLAK
ncbi:outer membrane beta-barrel protein [Rufibacter hautae]|uniref:PorT family protein n=1 Tax=Rufibacter hautae TaxID=2595005 RepID=A0A5B6T7N3_9BACT|nr:outer membrane beta-barrel protein [Rufibacter hautae]KAA3436166.1 PorT family protein [Rufibacter hautae]